jgi:hypothetical protein
VNTDKKAAAAERTLERMGFVYCGGDEWYWPGNNIAPIDRPKRVEGIDSLCDRLYARLSEIEYAVSECEDIADDIEAAYG